MTGNAAESRVAQAFARFARNEARGWSDIYERLATSISVCPSLLRLVAQLPRAKQQPNLVLAAMRHVCGPILDTDSLVDSALSDWSAIRRVVLSRSTQTNEPGRCAVLLPLLASLPQPLALLEVGASAGLCLIPDRYAYRFNDGSTLGPSSTPVFPCSTIGTAPIPDELPSVVWRRGLDIAAVDLNEPDQAAWLETLVWPGQDERLARLRDAISVARADPPLVQTGDLRTDLGALAAEAPRGATLVVFHTAVLAYLDCPSDRERFAEDVAALEATWISNEAVSVFPQIAARLPVAPPLDRFVLAIDGEPVAFTGSHGQSLLWL